jgi:hypothetical protein
MTNAMKYGPKEDDFKRWLRKARMVLGLGALLLPCEDPMSPHGSAQPRDLQILPPNPRVQGEEAMSEEQDAEAAALELTEAVVTAMHQLGLKRRDLADRMSTTKGRVTQLLDGPNFTFLTAARLARSVGLRFTVKLEEP